MSDLKQKVLRYLFSPDDWANGKNPMKHRGTAMSNARHICKYPCHASTCEKQKLLDRIAQLEASTKVPCLWSHEAGQWVSECGLELALNGTLAENSFWFCPGCSATITHTGEHP